MLISTYTPRTTRMVPPPVTHMERSVKKLFLDRWCRCYPLSPGGFLAEFLNQCLSIKGWVKEGVQGVWGGEAFLGNLSILMKEKERRGRDCEIICVKHQSVIHSSHFLNALSENYEVLLLFLLFKWENETQRGKGALPIPRAIKWRIGTQSQFSLIRLCIVPTLHKSFSL